MTTRIFDDCTRCAGTGDWAPGRVCFRCNGAGRVERDTLATQIRDKRAHVVEVRGIIAAERDALATPRRVLGRAQREARLAQRVAQLAQLEAELTALETAP